MPECFIETKGVPERKLSLIDEFFLTMVRLRVGLLLEDLAVRFAVSVSSVLIIITSWVNFMYIDLKELCELPSKEVLTSNSLPCRVLMMYALMLTVQKSLFKTPQNLMQENRYIQTISTTILLNFSLGLVLKWVLLM